jgi:hypothetical protein
VVKEALSLCIPSGQYFIHFSAENRREDSVQFSPTKNGGKRQFFAENSFKKTFALEV